MNQENDHFEIKLNEREVITERVFVPLIFSYFIGAFGTALAIKPISQISVWPIVLGFIFIIGFTAAIYAIRVAVIDHFAGPPRLVFDATKMTLTPYDVIGRSKTFDCEELRSITLTKYWWWTSLIITVAGSSYAYPITAFAHESDIDALRATIRERLTRTETGRAKWAEIEALDETNRIFNAIIPWGTIGLGILCCGIFFAQTSIIRNQDIFGLMRLGANVPQFIFAGDIYRLVSANLLHLNFVDLFANMMFLAIFGTLVERQIGRAKFLFVIAISGLCAQICSAFSIYYFKKFLFSVGFSGALFGVFGAQAALHIRYSSQQPGRYRLPRRAWVFLLGVNLVFLPLLVPQIDFVAHLGGLVSGFIVMFILMTGTDQLTALRNSSYLAVLLTVGLIAVWGAGAIAAVETYLEPEGFNRQLGGFIQSLKSYDTLEPPVENAVAWAVAMEPDASPEMLKDALFLIDRAIKIKPQIKGAPQIDLAAFTDTMATIHYRLGNFVRAVELEQTLFDRQNPTYQSQLARFYDAYLKGEGPRISGDARVPLPRLTLTMPDAPNMPPLVNVSSDSIRPHGADLIALIKQGERLLGLVRLKIGTNYMGGDPMPNVRLDEPVAPGPNGAEITIQLAYFRAVCDCGQTTGRASYFAMKEDVRNWP